MDTPSDSNIGIKLRPGWQVFLLTLGTFGVYACLWFYSRAKEIKRMEVQNFWPWLWVFVPVVALAAAFALNNLADAYCKLARSKGSTATPRGLGLMGVMLMFVVITFAVLERVSFSSILYTIALLSFAAIMLMLNNAVRNFAVEIDCLDTSGFGKVRNIVAGVFYTLGSGAVSILIIILLLSEYSGERLNEEVPFVSENGQYRISFPDGWRANHDSFMNTDSLYYFLGPNMSEVGIHEYTGLSIDDVVPTRMLNLQDVLDPIDCKENRSFIANTFIRKVVLICTGKELGEDYSIGSAVLVFEDSTMAELYGSFPTENPSSVNPELERIIESFEPLPL